MDGALLLAPMLLSATSALAGIAKMPAPAGTRKSIVDFGAPEFLSRLVARLLTLVELTCATALLPAPPAVWAAAGTLALLLLFIAAIGIGMARCRLPECHCFGQLHSTPVGWNT